LQVAIQKEKKSRQQNAAKTKELYPKITKTTTAIAATKKRKTPTQVTTTQEGNMTRLK